MAFEALTHPLLSPFRPILAPIPVALAILANPAPSNPSLHATHQIARDLEPEGQAAWPIYHNALVTHVDDLTDYDNAARQPRETSALFDYDRSLSYGEWNDPRYDETKATLIELAPVFDALSNAADAPRYGAPIDLNPTEADTAFDSAQIQLKRLGYYNALAMRNAAASDDWERLLDHARSGLALGEHLSRASLALTTLVGWSVTSATLAETRHALLDHDVPIETTRALTSLLDLDPLKSMRHAITIEQHAFTHQLESLHDPSGVLAIWALRGINETGVPSPPPSTLAARLFNIVALRYPTYTETVRRNDVYTSRVLTTLSVLPDAPLARIERPLEALDRFETDDLALGIIRPAQHLLAKPAMQLERDIRATRLMLVLEAHLDEHGDSPDSLNSELFSAHHIDPITGEPFIYTPTTDASNASCYTLRSTDSSFLGRDIDAVDYTAPRPPFPD